MVKYGLDYTRCRWILPLLLGIGVIFGIIALSGRGWLESQTLPYIHQASLWQSCRRPEQGGEWSCESLMGYGSHHIRQSAPNPLHGEALACLKLKQSPGQRNTGIFPGKNTWTSLTEEGDGGMGKLPPHVSVATKCWPLNPSPGDAPTTGDSALPSAPLGKQGQALADPLLPTAAVVAGVICFALAIIAFAIDTLRFNFIRGIGGLLFVAAMFSIMGLVIYPVKFSTEIEMTGINMFSWAYGFGWTTAIMEICLGFFFCCLPNYEDQILGNVKPTYFYSAP
ncbi:hypothetical protein Q9233_013667 [Columba guinea]|nr:hypothetical protein Q9233_013667 [Columba guinea]